MRLHVWDIEGLQNRFLATQHPRRRSQPGKDHRDLIMDVSWKYHEIPLDLANHMEWYGMIWMWKTNTFSKTNLFVILRYKHTKRCGHYESRPTSWGFMFSLPWILWLHRHLCAHQFIIYTWFCQFGVTTREFQGAFGGIAMSIHIRYSPAIYNLT